MNPVHAVPIRLSQDGSTAVAATKIPKAEDTLFIGSSQEAEDDDPLLDAGFTTTAQDSNAGSSKAGVPRPASNKLASNTAPSEFATPGGSSTKRKRAATGAANGTPGTPIEPTKAMKRRKNDIDTLKAQLAHLEYLRDEARLKREAEQRRTEDEAVSIEQYCRLSP